MLDVIIYPIKKLDNYLKENETPEDRALCNWLDEQISGCVAVVITSMRPELELLVLRKIEESHSTEISSAEEQSNELVLPIEATINAAIAKEYYISMS